METEVQAQGPSGASQAQLPAGPAAAELSTGTGLMGAQHCSLPRPRVPDLQNSIQGWEGPPGQWLCP